MSIIKGTCQCGKSIETQDKENAEFCLECNIEIIGLRSQAHVAFNLVVSRIAKKFGIGKRPARQHAVRWLGCNVLKTDHTKIKVGRLSKDECLKVIEAVKRG